MEGEMSICGKQEQSLPLHKNKPALSEFLKQNWFIHPRFSPHPLIFILWNLNPALS